VNIYRLLANATFWFHMLWVAILLAGLPLSAFYPWYRPIHGIVVLTTVASQIIWLGCPLTMIECAFRAKYDPSTSFTGSFVTYYLKKWFNVTVPAKVVVIQLLVMLALSIVFVLKTS